MKIKRPFLGPSTPNETMGFLLLSANPMYEPDQRQEVFARIEQRPVGSGRRRGNSTGHRI
jgi:hypothetical protein